MANYMIVSEDNIAELETAVRIKMQEGWKLAGGVAVAYTHVHSEHKHVPGHLVYVQAMEKP